MSLKIAANNSMLSNYLNDLEIINMSNSLKKMKNSEPELLNKMKQVIIKQQYEIDKRVRMLEAVSHNVEYLLGLHMEHEKEVERAMINTKSL